MKTGVSAELSHRSGKGVLRVGSGYGHASTGEGDWNADRADRTAQVGAGGQEITGLEGSRVILGPDERQLKLQRGTCVCVCGEDVSPRTGHHSSRSKNFSSYAIEEGRDDDPGRAGRK